MGILMKLFLVHCGYYDSEIGDGIYESHVNFFVAAENFEEARAKVKTKDPFKLKKMHVDGLQEIQSVDGFQIALMPDSSIEGRTVLISHKHRDLAPKSHA